MKRRWRWFVGLLLVACISEYAFARKPEATSQNWPSYFAPDDENAGFDDAEPPPDAVLDTLLTRPEVAETADELQNKDRGSLRKLFQTVRVNLGKADEDDYVVLGTFPMSGGDCNWFWVVRTRQGKGETILFAPGLSLLLQKRLTNGYRDIKQSGGTAAFRSERLYRYNGIAYRLLRERTWAVKP
ncbi:hypothetical protein ACFPT7_24905 [Acidicapsa dinghuensis]|uniref:DUF4893 domain-containing protein n=1 Tax=Acidicapsa dinghuensis TaxID=2218256 RepID=A0ABW1ENH1_9BACT|nr:hypothetical protein [Acidicapsa dinghuensis]